MKIILMGTPQFAVYALNALLSSRHTVLAVVSQPDKAKDRKGNLLHTPLKEAAVKSGVPVLQFNSIKNEGLQTLKNLNADIFVTAAYGQILSRQILDIPKYGVINIHASLLPKYRGSSPIECAVMMGDNVTGITIMQTAEGLDSGDIIMTRQTDIVKNETAAELTLRLAQIGADLLLEALDAIENNTATFTKQEESKATKCNKITKDMCRIDWSNSAQNIHNMVRALPAFTHYKDRLIKVLATRIVNDDFCASSRTGQFFADKSLLPEISNKMMDKPLMVFCGKGIIEILRLTPEGAKPMSGKDFLIGIRTLDDSTRFDC